MKVFVSWSGALSKNVAVLLNSWIENVLQGVEVWISKDDIDKGAIWFTELANALSETGVGIICVTQQNLSAPWILFESGALSKGLSKNRVCPLLVNLIPQQLNPPLSHFNAASPTKDDMLKLVKLINEQQGEKKVTDTRLPQIFDKWWGDFDAAFKKIIEEDNAQVMPAQRSQEEMLAELLELSRSIQRILMQGRFPFGASALASLLHGGTLPFGVESLPTGAGTVFGMPKDEPLEKRSELALEAINQAVKLEKEKPSGSTGPNNLLPGG